jgi:xanthine dehydrogenase molybdopterin-binding subunit B
MDHIAKAIQKDPVDVRLKNLRENDSNIQNMIQDIKITADFEERKWKVEEFNKVSSAVYHAFLLFLQIDILTSDLMSFRPFLLT